MAGGGCTVGLAQTQNQQTQPDAGLPSGEGAAPAAALSGAYLMPGAEGGESESYWTLRSRPALPGIVGGYGSSLAFLSEMERSNYIRGGLTLQTTYDSNALLSNPAESSYTYSIFPQIALDQSRSRVRWLLNYAGGFTYNQKLSTQNQTSQNFNFDLEYRLAPHVNLRVTQVVNLTTGLFGPVNTFNGTAPGVPVGTNPFVLTPLSKTLRTVTQTDMSYQFSATDAVGTSGGFNILRYRDTPPGIALVDTTSEDAAAYYMHRVTSSDWVGGSYVFQHLGYSPVINDTVVHSAIAFDTWQLKPSMTISLFIGPQYSDNRFPSNSTSSQALYSTKWSASAGASYGWQARHTSISLAYARRIADGGGALGSVMLDSVEGSLRQQVTPRWVFALYGNYGANNALIPAGGLSQSTNSAAGGVSVTRQFGPNCFLEVGYSRQNQSTTGVSSLTSDASKNLVIASFSYQFARPWGR
jgi:hypothetical protein